MFVTHLPNYHSIALIPPCMPPPLHARPFKVNKAVGEAAAKADRSVAATTTEASQKLSALTEEADRRVSAATEGLVRLETERDAALADLRKATQNRLVSANIS